MTARTAASALARNNISPSIGTERRPANPRPLEATAAAAAATAAPAAANRLQTHDTNGSLTTGVLLSIVSFAVLFDADKSISTIRASGPGPQLTGADVN